MLQEVPYNRLAGGFVGSRRIFHMGDLETIGHVLIYFYLGKLPWQGLPGRNKEEKYASTDPEIFLEHMNIKCKKVIMSRPGRPETDIQGALSLAHQLATSQTDNDKYLIIFYRSCNF